MLFLIPWAAGPFVPGAFWPFRPEQTLPLCWTFIRAQSVEMHQQATPQEAVGEGRLFFPGGPHFPPAESPTGTWLPGEGWKLALASARRGSFVQGCFLLTTLKPQLPHNRGCGCAFRGPGLGRGIFWPGNVWVGASRQQQWLEQSNLHGAAAECEVTEK